MIELKKLRNFSGTLTEFIKELEKHRRRYPLAKIYVEADGQIQSLSLMIERGEKDEGGLSK